MDSVTLYELGDVMSLSKADLRMMRRQAYHRDVQRAKVCLEWGDYLAELGNHKAAAESYREAAEAILPRPGERIHLS